MKSLLQFLFLLLASTNVLAQEMSLVHQDEKRKFIVYTPASYASLPGQRFPLVVNFHGRGMSMRDQMFYTQMNRTADRENFIVVYPQGLKQDWNVGHDGANYLQGTDDIGFTQAMLAKIGQTFRIDERRIYATGLSRGGFFSLRLAAELAPTFAAVAAVGALMPRQVIEHHTKPGKIGVMLMHGTADQIVTFDGKQDHYLSAADTYRYWVRNNALGAAALRERKFTSKPGDATTVTSIEQGDAQVHVALVTIKDGGHTWAGADAFNIGLPLGSTSTTIDANTVLWEFLSKHRK